MTNITKLIFEWGMLRRVKSEGWRTAGVDIPCSVADHSLRAAQIGYVLACMENYKDPNEVCTMLVFHDIGECRVGDIHKIAITYINVDEEKAVKDQLAPVSFGNNILKMWQEVDYGSSIAGNIAKDADLLEQAFTGKEYSEKGYKYTEDWIKRVSLKVKTKSAKKLIEEMQKIHSNEWWQGLKEKIIKEGI